MESNSIHNLIELLKSQLVTYTEIMEVLSDEKEAVSSWKPNVIVELNKKKEQLAKRERLLEDARNTITLRLMEEYGIYKGSLQDIIEVCPDEESKQELSNLRLSLLNVANEISNITFSLKVLYNANLKIISDIKLKMGYMPSTNKYGMEKSNVSMPASLHITG